MSIGYKENYMEITEFTRFEGVVDKFQVVSMG
jgi:hypothetical protein